MKKLLVLCICTALLLAGCNVNMEPTIPEPTIAPVPTATETNTHDSVEVQTQLLAVSVPSSTEITTLDDGTELFSYTSQYMHFLFPDEEVADKVILDFLNRVDMGRQDADTILEMAKHDYDEKVNWYPYFYQILYSPTRIDYGVLSLFGTQSSYSGGIHGNISCVAANYDLMTGDVLSLGSIMHENADKEDFINIIIDMLEPMAEEYFLYEDYTDGVRNRLDVDENLYEDFYFTNTGLCFFFSPYEIAPYSSGVITVEIPYNALPGLIYDGYFPAEQERTHGNLFTSEVSKINMEQFDNIAEVNLASNESALVAYPNGTIKNVQILVSTDEMSMPEHTVFAAYEMSDKDAVIINVNDSDMEDIQIQYSSDSMLFAVQLVK